MSVRKSLVAVLLGLGISTAAWAENINEAANNNMPQASQRQAYGAFPPLYYNYYYPGQPDGQIPARMYLSPIPVPEYVGYTYITYNPLAPQEMMHRHAREYVRFHPSGGYSNTQVSWEYHDHRPVVIRGFMGLHRFMNTR